MKASTIQAMKQVFQATYPGVKCAVDTKTVEPAFIYQDGPALQEVQALLAPFRIQVIRLLNAAALGKVAAAHLHKFVNANNSFSRRGFIEGYIVFDHCCTFAEKQATTEYAMSLDIAEI
jgi:hypothetical protein